MTHTNPITIGAVLKAHSIAGPCLTLGKVIKTTAKTITYANWTGRSGDLAFDMDDVRRVGGWRVAGSFNVKDGSKTGWYHTDDCNSCSGGSNYPNGYWD